MRADLRYSSIQRNAQTGQLEATSGHSGLLDFVGTNQGYALASQGEGTFESTAESYRAESERVIRLDAEARQHTVGSSDRTRIERERDQTIDRLHNAKGNIEKFVADPTSGMTPTQISALQQAQQGGATTQGQPGQQNPYGASSGASYKVAEAARLALQEINAIEGQYGTTILHRDYSGGNQGDRV